MPKKEKFILKKLLFRAKNGKKFKNKKRKKKSFWHKNWQIIKNKKISFRAKNGKFKKK